MARQAGNTRITGTIDEFCFYRMDGEYYVRKKSRMTGKRFWKDKAFEGSRRSCSRFGGGNKIASKVYRMVDGEKRVYKLFCFLRRRAVWLLKDGMESEKVEKILMEYMVDFGFLIEAAIAPEKQEAPAVKSRQTVVTPDFISRRPHKKRKTGNLATVPSEFLYEGSG